MFGVFPGVDMSHVTCSPECKSLMVDDWFKYSHPLKEFVSGYVKDFKHERWVAASTIYRAILNDERAYSGPVDSALGLKFLNVLTTNSLEGSERQHLLKFYREVGIDVS